MDAGYMVPFFEGFVAGALASLLFLVVFCSLTKKIEPGWSFLLGMLALGLLRWLFPGLLGAPRWIPFGIGAAVGAIVCTVWIYERGKLCSIDPVADAIKKELNERRNR